MEVIDGTEVTAYMGETAPEYYQGSVAGWTILRQIVTLFFRERKMFYHAVGDCHWTYYDHSNFLCFGEIE